MENRLNGDPLIRRTKIVATLGPATANASAIGALLQAGANVVRINASHGTPELRDEWITAARRAADAIAMPVKKRRSRRHFRLAGNDRCLGANSAVLDIEVFAF